MSLFFLLVFFIIIIRFSYSNFHKRRPHNIYSSVTNLFLSNKIKKKTSKTHTSCAITAPRTYKSSTCPAVCLFILYYYFFFLYLRILGLSRRRRFYPYFFIVENSINRPETKIQRKNNNNQLSLI